MKRLAFALLLSLSCVSPVAAQETKSTELRVLEERARSLAKVANAKTVCVIGLAGSGTGAVISPEGLTVTNAHVAALSRVAILAYSNGERVMARRLGIDFERDLALYIPLARPAQPLPYFERAEASPKPSTWVAAIGFPGGPKSSPAPAFSLGLVTGGKGPKAVNGILNYDDALVTDVPLFPGNSGGPLVSLDGKLLGINGAVNLAGGESYTIPIERVEERLPILKQEDLILLPGGMRIELSKSQLTRRLFDLIDPILMRQLQSRLDSMKASDSAKGRLNLDVSSLPKELSDALGSFEESDELALRARKTARSKAMLAGLAPALARSRELTIEIAGPLGPVYATRINERFAVAPLRRLGAARRYELRGGLVAELVRAAPGQNLALLVLSRPQSAVAIAEAPVGSLVVSGEVAGTLSVQGRPVSALQSAQIALGGGGIPEPVKKILERISAIAERLGQREVAQLLREMFKSLNLRQNYMRGSRPQGFEKVLSHDAPLAPSEVGKPLVDSRGRLLGVNVANAHYGTSYAVSVAALRKAFPELGGASKNLSSSKPESVTPGRRAKLY